jgi:hypothetical protein
LASRTSLLYTRQLKYGVHNKLKTLLESNERIVKRQIFELEGLVIGAHNSFEVFYVYRKNCKLAIMRGSSDGPYFVLSHSELVD